MGRIAADLNCSKNMIFNAVKTYTKTGSYKNRVRRNRPRKTTEREDRAITRLSKENPFLTAKDINTAVSDRSYGKVYQKGQFDVG